MKSPPQHRFASSPPGVARVPSWLADEYLESYIRWREESATVRRAYELCDRIEQSERSLAFAAYGAALDREEQAARGFREHVDRVARCLS